MATIKDIAKNLDLSFSTVSRALNNHPAISKKTKQLVEAEALRLNFAFNTSAKSLTSNKAYTITLLVNIDDEQSFQNPYFYEEMHGIERFVYQKEYSLIVANIKTAPKKQNMIDFLVKSKRTDGIILPSNIIDDELVDKLCNHNIPFVSIGQPTISNEPISWVDIDNFRGGQSAAQHLIDNGCKKIAIFGYNPKKFFSQKRFEGYVAALLAHNLPINKELVATCGNSKENGYVFARLYIPGKKYIFGFLLSIMMIPGLALIVPQFELAVRFNLYNNIWGVILFYSAWVTPFSTFLIKGYIEDNVPRELEESIKVDGGSVFVVYRHIILPLTSPVVASISILNFLFPFEELGWATAILKSDKYRTLPVAITMFFQSHARTDWGYVFAMTTLAMIPVLLIYVLLQRYFVSGLASGAIKE